MFALRFLSIIATLSATSGFLGIQPTTIRSLQLSESVTENMAEVEVGPSGGSW
jgi:hypothetical protein